MIGCDPMEIRTKIICTIGPQVKSLDKIIALIQAGMNVARLNFSHGTYDEHLESIQLLKKAREMLGVPLGIMLDTKGPEIRLGKIKNGGVTVQAGQSWKLVPDTIEGDEERGCLTPSLSSPTLKLATKFSLMMATLWQKSSKPLPSLWS